jgi:predicted regulator of Ras-like GTPase activity (Roadblock/LC7/MglB family)
MIPILPEGIPVAEMECVLSELIHYTKGLVVGVRITAGEGTGYLIIDHGQPLAVFFSTDYRRFIGRSALEFLGQIPRMRCEIFAYGEEELKSAREFSATNGWILSADGGASEEISDQEKIAVIANQPGVIGVSAFHEGFPVYAVGNGDFEQVSAIAEDLLRTGQMIARELQMDALQQLILETGRGKVLIAPFGDLFLCVNTAPDAHLGLLRLAIRGIQ